ncbi:Uncharacterised protein [[Clostridium] sordellii]|uniref:hypothetical protein n=2 Tax=Paraclostridium sordellii TaxID=1505 RepID=UPI0005DA8468|nr:hypothetical protein [Paeniclostridium sordellii]CEO07693.1 Uncharacterised protein [[Clostridium] sordellii] [Paeniclostridium sordellii]CEP84637.1 Uncharacterised protein [[Clostridium] sordellii] [Paeniclostridium sordellii]
MNRFEKMENNINMNYKDMGHILLSYIVFSLPIILSIIFLLNRSIHLIIVSEVENENVSVKVTIKFFFNLINMTKTLYPITKKEKKKSNLKYKKNKEDKSSSKRFDLKKIEVTNLVVLYRIVKKIKITEVYSNLSYGSENISFTSFIYVLVNAVYGNISNYLESEKMYLKVRPCYTRNYIRYRGILHLSPTIKDIIIIIRGIFKIYFEIRKYKKIKYNKEEDSNEISKFHKKSNGYNS